MNESLYPELSSSPEAMIVQMERELQAIKNAPQRLGNSSITGIVTGSLDSDLWAGSLAGGSGFFAKDLTFAATATQAPLFGRWIVQLYVAGVEYTPENAYSDANRIDMYVSPPRSDFATSNIVVQKVRLIASTARSCSVRAIFLGTDDVTVSVT